MLLGPTAVADKKVEWAKSPEPLVILGVEVLITSTGIKCTPSQQHIDKWLGTIGTALAEEKMCPGTASKLAGALSWGAQNMFARQATIAAT